ncbi:MAG: cation diffusion facilitator family transporter [Candidatus Woesearchaeota archaeon]
MHECHDHHKSNNLKWSMLIIGSIFIVELIGGLVSGSLALVSDSFHMLMDFFALFLAFFALKVSSSMPTNRRTFGLHRTEILAALANGLVMFAVSGFIIYRAVLRIMDPQGINAPIMLIVAAVGLIANLVVLFKLHGHHDLNMKGAYLHVLGDTLSSVAVIAGAIVIYFTGIVSIDPILSFLIVGIILYNAIRLVWESLHILLEGVPFGINVDEVIREMKRSKKVKDVHAVHIWSVCSNICFMSAHVVVDAEKICDTVLIEQELNKRLEKFNIRYATFQFANTKCSSPNKLRMIRH